MATTYRSALCAFAPAKSVSHDWHATLSAGWYQCAHCKQSGVCLRCLLEAGVEHVPFGPMRLECERHVLVLPDWKAADGPA